MPTKDYVRTPQKRKPTKKSQQKLPIFRIVLAVAFIVLFIFALFQLSQSGENNAVSDQHATSDIGDIELQQTTNTTDKNDILVIEDNNAIEMAELPPLPVLDDEEWEYIDSLPEFSVEVDATGPIESDGIYILQCGSFRKETQANVQKAKIAFQGIEARIIPSTEESGLWYRVIIGPYDNKRAAEVDKRAVRKQNVNKCDIRRQKQKR